MSRRRKKKVEPDVKSIIEKEMKEYDLSPEDVPQSKPHFDPKEIKNYKPFGEQTQWRYFMCNAFAHFKYHDISVQRRDDHPKCETSRRTWASAHSWCVIDLKLQCIEHCWVQECKECEGESKPVYDEESLERMAKYAVKMFAIHKGIKLKEQPDQARRRGRDKGPHEESLCEVCKLSLIHI